jgi:hypothetical protein
MSSTATRVQAKGSLELVEEAVHLLRTAPAGALAAYFAGTVPFVLAALYFWADMSRSAFATQHLVGAAAGLALLFLWMKFCQAMFTRQLQACVASRQLPPLSLPQALRILAAQGALQPTGLFVLLAALLVVLPFGWAYAFYQNLTVLGQGSAGTSGRLVRRSARQARLWPAQNHVLLALVFGFGLVVFLNWGMVCYLVPELLKLLFGVESVFTRSGLSLLNTTYFAVVGALTYLSLDPIVKAVYTLRCFYGESLHSGEDLKAELTRSRLVRPELLLALLLALTVQLPAQTAAPAGPPPATVAPEAEARRLGSSVSPAELDQAIRDVAQRRKYAWRMPRETVVEEREPGVFRQMLARVGEWLEQAAQKVGGWLDKWLRKLFFRQRKVSLPGSGYGWILAQELLVYGLLLAVIAAVAYLAIRLWRSRNHSRNAVASTAIQTAPDLNDENLGAEQLPEDAWTKLARELLAQGDLRLALRAFYLSSLANLAERNLLRLARFKSNRDYERELSRRSHVLPELPGLFGENVSAFDGVWYGMREVTREGVERFALNVERIKGAT